MGISVAEVPIAPANGLRGEERWSAASEATLRVLVEKYLAQYLYENALFLAERLHAQNASAENLHLLATCYLHASMPQRAYGALTRGMDVAEAVDCDDVMVMQNRYLLAKSCMALGHLREAEAALIKGTVLATHGPQRSQDEVLRGNVRVPNDAAGLYLLGIICERDNRRDHATAYFALALRLDPFLWDAFEHLCKLGVDAAPESFFGRCPLQISEDGRVLTWETNPAALGEDNEDEDDADQDEDLNASMDLLDEDGVQGNENAAPRPSRRGFRTLHSRNEREPDSFDEAPVPVPLAWGKRGGTAGHATSQQQAFWPGFAHVSTLRLLTGSNAGSAGHAAPGTRTRSRSRSRHGAPGTGTGAGSRAGPGLASGGYKASNLLVSTGFSLHRSSKFPWHPSPTLAEGQELAVSRARDLQSLQICKDNEVLAGELQEGASVDDLGPSGDAQHQRQDYQHQHQHQHQHQAAPPSPPQQHRPVTRRSSRRTGSSAGSGVGARARSANMNAMDAENQQGSHSNSNVQNENVMDVVAEKPAEHRQQSSMGDGGDDVDAEVDNPAQSAISVDALVGSLFVLDLLRVLGEGYQLVSQYKCDDALAAFAKLPAAQQATGWVAHQQGRACFEMADYRRAKYFFENMRSYAPDRTAGLEIYSTNLWHLKEEVELCYLAQQAIEIDRRSPEVWCVLGNCFSLQKEHDLAIKFFRRALMLDPTFTYASTLSGHEYVSNEDFEKATSCYRAAISNDARHYPAWYGLGTIYYRQEKYAVAEFHFRRAVAINPRSSVLYCYLGMVLHASDRCEEALEILHRASMLEPGNPQARFQRALVLRTMECFDAALEELEAVRDSAPHESSVHFLMGKLCKQLDRRDEAMVHFTTALDLDPKDANLIKLAIDKLDSDDLDEAEEL